MTGLMFIRKVKKIMQNAYIGLKILFKSNNNAFNALTWWNSENPLWKMIENAKLSQSSIKYVTKFVRSILNKSVTSRILRPKNVFQIRNLENLSTFLFVDTFDERHKTSQCCDDWRKEDCVTDSWRHNPSRDRQVETSRCDAKACRCSGIICILASGFFLQL